ncbi:MAG: hypothetical protein BGO67_05075 [Alphaproteobacteria bacterium 41-28]|nr:MAG: hypothetical protein BGO67_05075 [Alphaproteobacteria bacterium 41-28]
MASSFIALNVCAMNSDETVELIGAIQRQAQGNFQGTLRIPSEDGNFVTRVFNLRNIQHRRYERFTPPGIDRLEPPQLLTDWGYAKELISCNVDGYEHRINVLLPRQYPLSGRWVYQEDRDNTNNLAILKLSARLNDQRWKVIYRREREIQHLLLREGPERSGRYYFDGEDVYRSKTSLHYYRNQQNNQEYRRVIGTRDGKIKGHKKNEVIYVEPFSPRGSS